MRRTAIAALKTGSLDGVGIKICCYGVRSRLYAIDGEAEESERQHVVRRICALHNPDRAGCRNDRGPRDQHQQWRLGSGSYDKPCDHPFVTPEIECAQTDGCCPGRLLCQTGHQAEQCSRADQHDAPSNAIAEDPSDHGSDASCR